MSTNFGIAPQYQTALTEAKKVIGDTITISPFLRSCLMKPG